MSQRTILSGDVEAFSRWNRSGETGGATCVYAPMLAAIKRFQGCSSLLAMWTLS